MVLESGKFASLMARTYPLSYPLFTLLTHFLLDLCNHESSDEVLKLSDLYRLSRTQVLVVSAKSRQVLG